jgi:hypothetical protein
VNLEFEKGRYGAPFLFMAEKQLIDFVSRPLKVKNTIRVIVYSTICINWHQIDFVILTIT